MKDLSALTCRRGFSLVELVIVVMIIGVLGAIAIPRVSRGSEGAGVNAFIAQINTLGNGIQRYEAETGKKISDTRTGVFPPELAEYVREQNWSKPTPIGGYWDVESDDSGIVTAVGVHFFDSPDDPQAALEIDQRIDDGNLSTGAFRKIRGSGYYLVLD